MSEFTNTTFSSDAVENTETTVQPETVIMDEVESTLVDAEVGETLPEELPEVTTISDEVTDTTE